MSENTTHDPMEISLDDPGAPTRSLIQWWGTWLSLPLAGAKAVHRAGWEGAHVALQKQADLVRFLSQELSDREHRGEDWSVLVPNAVEAVVVRSLSTLFEEGAPRGLRELVSEAATLLAALYQIPTDILQQYADLAATAQRTLRFAEDRAGHEETRARPHPEHVKRVLRNYLRLSDDLLSAGHLSSADWQVDASDDFEPTESLIEILHQTFATDAIGLLDRVTQRGRDVVHQFRMDPVFVKDALRLVEIFDFFTGPPSGAETEDPGFGNPLFAVRGITGSGESWLLAEAGSTGTTGKPFSYYSELKALQTDDSERQARLKQETAGRVAEDQRRYTNDVWLGIRQSDTVALKVWQEQAWEEERHSREKWPRGGDNVQPGTWFFLNGVATDHYVAQLNAECLADLFQTRVHILHNETGGLYEDLRECVRGRVANLTTGAVVNAVTFLLAELLRQGQFHVEATEPVVLITHSQGTIIGANLVRALSEPAVVHLILQKYLRRRICSCETEAVQLVRMNEAALGRHLDHVLERMEVYNFASCSDDYPRKEIPPGSGSLFPRTLEHYINEFDIVPRLAPQKEYNLVGDFFDRPGAWGHLLNVHYLEGFPRGLYQAVDSDRPSRLLSYYRRTRREAPAT